MSRLEVISGDAYTGDRRLTVLVTNPDGTATDLTGVDLTFQVKRFHGGTALITKTTPTAIELTDAEEGEARIELDEGDTDDLSKRYIWELEADDSEGKLTLASGTFYVTQDLIEA